MRRWSVLVAVVLAAAACTSSDGGSQTPRSTSGANGSTSVGAPGVAPSTSSPGGDAADATPLTSGTTAPPPSAVRPDQPDRPAPSAQVPPLGPVGTHAAFYLRADASRSILLDVRHQDGAAPLPATLDRVRRVLGQVARKPVEVRTGAIGGGARSWTSGDIRALADEGPESTVDAAVMRLLFLRGGLAEGDTALGVAVRSDVAALFPDRISQAAGLLGSVDRLELAVTTHEVGHLLGLVDLVLDTGRDDPEHPGHSRNRESVMYYAVESTLVGSILDGGPPVDFDSDDLADLATIAGR